MSECPLCSAQVALSSDIVCGELVQCGDCGAELEVTNVSPPALAQAPEEGEDWGE